MTAIVTNGSSQNVAEISQGDQIVDLLRQVILQMQDGPDQFDDVLPQLTMQQLRVMRILYNEGPTRVSALARRLNVSTPTVTGILDRLVQRGMTEREDDPRDRRVVLNVLTEAGTQAMDRLHPVQNDRVQKAVSQLDEVELHALINGLGKLLQAVESQ